MSPPYRPPCAPYHQLRRHILYRAYLRNLQRLPDPYAWSVLQPSFRSLLSTPPILGAAGSSESEIPSAESSKQAQMREAKRLRQLKRARSELYALHAAVECQPHALSRLLEEVYAIRGKERWRIMHSISSSYPTPQPSPPSPSPSLPPPLLPLIPLPPAKLQSPPSDRLRPVPPVALRTAARRRAAKERESCKVPLVLPSASDQGELDTIRGELDPSRGERERGVASAQDASGRAVCKPVTGLEGKGVVEALRILAGLWMPLSALHKNSDSAHGQGPATAPRDLPTYLLLPPHIRLLIPRSSPLPPPHSSSALASSPSTRARTERHALPIGLRQSTPAPGHTRPNPRLWTPPVRYTARIVRRAFKMLWDKLVWVRRRPEPVWAKSRKAELTWERWERCTYDQAFPGDRQGFVEGPGREAIGGLGYGRGSADDAARLTAHISPGSTASVQERTAS